MEVRFSFASRFLAMKMPMIMLTKVITTIATMMLRISKVGNSMKLRWISADVSSPTAP